ncbi:ShlB/FhaC/HecB family hemolysin secretion/activation protein [Sphingosinicella sp. CPCC 101087]|uniref:ShlB/FhaC/HecB family hemolysin secretion/activation protein n=1 Tax=Sphingosinicella sp. CPCC 101087 TaxID=2497754 RepID=UPI00101DA9F0|nr:ShlB/FhaC/HecB family hemolysin secretion/activation protein [Sphingosinicella sp. CPCC 101087]
MVLAARASHGFWGSARRSPADSWRGRSFLHHWKLAAAGGAILFCGAAEAQVVPPSATPPTREEVERPLPDRREPASPRLTVEGGVERAPCALDRPEYRDVRFTLNDVQFDSLRGLPAEALRPAFAPFVGQEHPVSIICEIRDRAATILRDSGYVAAVEVPEQRIADGTVRFEVLMARLVGLRVRGDAGRAERLIAGYLEPLTEREVFNRHDAERALLLVGDLPGYDVRLSLRSAGGARGEVIGEVLVRHTPVLADFSIQNFGSTELGRWGGLLRGQFFGLTGLGDRTVVALFSTPDFHEQQTVQIAHDFRLGSQGLAIGGQITFAWANPELDDDAVDVESRTLFATLEASYPFVRRQDRTLRGALGLDLVDQDVEFNGLDLSRDRLRVAFARLDYDAVGLSQDPRYRTGAPVWRLGASAELRQGLDILGASAPCGPALAACLVPGVVPPARLEGDPTATVLRGTLNGEYRPDPRFTIGIGARGQYSERPLFSFEEFAAGNFTIGRGYDPGTILGDSGLGLQAELRYGSLFPRGPDAFAFEPFLFADQSWVWNEDRLFAFDRQELTSVGGGLRAAWGNRLRLELLLAVPLDRTLFQPDRDPRLLVSVTTRLWPWSSR